MAIRINDDDFDRMVKRSQREARLVIVAAVALVAAGLTVAAQKTTRLLRKQRSAHARLSL